MSGSGGGGGERRAEKGGEDVYILIFSIALELGVGRYLSRLTMTMMPVGVLRRIERFHPVLNQYVCTSTPTLRFDQ